MADYSLFDRDGLELVHNDLQKKQEWCKDVERYSGLYPGIIVLFHVSWVAVKMVTRAGTVTEVSPMNGLWAASINNLVKACEPRILHTYQQRTTDQNGNARDSYVLNLRKAYFRELESDQQSLEELH